MRRVLRLKFTPANDPAAMGDIDMPATALQFVSGQTPARPQRSASPCRGDRIAVEGARRKGREPLGCLIGEAGNMALMLRFESAANLGEVVEAMNSDEKFVAWRARTLKAGLHMWCAATSSTRSLCRCLQSRCGQQCAWPRALGPRRGPNSAHRLRTPPCEDFRGRPRGPPTHRRGGPAGCRVFLRECRYRARRNLVRSAARPDSAAPGASFGQSTSSNSRRAIRRWRWAAKYANRRRPCRPGRLCSTREPQMRTVIRPHRWMRVSPLSCALSKVSPRFIASTRRIIRTPSPQSIRRHHGQADQLRVRPDCPRPR
jgi:hypothetical protein